MPAPQLPVEIVVRILDLTNASSSDLKLLQSCSLVCKAWSAHAQKMLFRSVSISMHREYTALVAAFQPHTPHGSTGTMRKPHLMRSPSLPFIAAVPGFLPTLGFTYPNILRGSVIELNVIIDFDQPDGLTFARLSHVVSLCPNLRKIGISVFGVQPGVKDAVGTTDRWRMRRLAPPVPDKALEALRTAPNASRISELRLNDWSDNSGILIQLLDVWPHITSLKLAGKLPTITNGTDSIFSTISLNVAPCALEALSLNCATGTESSIDFVKWLLAGSRQTLRRLEFLKEPSGKLLEDTFVRSVFPLESVYLPSCASPMVEQIIRHRLGPTGVPMVDDDDDIDGGRAFVQVQGLKEVFVEDPSTPFKLLVSIVHSETVQKFGFGVDGRTHLLPVARAIKAQTGLKRIAIWISDGRGRVFGLGSLRIACAIKGIELEETQDVKEFRAWRI
ncbi:hypothetical protein BDM02DRAFT_3112291 [Thelephora ganbajun]|uniref:Uncharacterized protein n=1 Tax=Thelephora ganbajun TaxID=370292 RepID=A0ACB6ZLX0_THEGA|nr:hypothetical protein BDM02DRAFT_3112291 [Thelephora ganbajun]